MKMPPLNRRWCIDLELSANRMPRAGDLRHGEADVQIVQRTNRSQRSRREDLVGGHEGHPHPRAREKLWLAGSCGLTVAKCRRRAPLIRYAISAIESVTTEELVGGRRTTASGWYGSSVPFRPPPSRTG